MKIQRFNENENNGYIQVYYQNEIYFNIFDNTDGDEYEIYTKISDRITELEKYDVDYDIFYYSKDKRFFIFIYPQVFLYNQIKSDYLFSTGTNKEETRKEYLESGAILINKEDVLPLLQSNKFNI